MFDLVFMHDLPGSCVLDVEQPVAGQAHHHFVVLGHVERADSLAHLHAVGHEATPDVEDAQVGVVAGGGDAFVGVEQLDHADGVFVAVEGDDVGFEFGLVHDGFFCGVEEWKFEDADLHVV